LFDAKPEPLQKHFTRQLLFVVGLTLRAVLVALDERSQHLRQRVQRDLFVQQLQLGRIQGLPGLVFGSHLLQFQQLRLLGLELHDGSGLRIHRV